MLKASSILVVLLVNLACVFGQFDIQVKLFTKDNLENPVILNNSTQAYVFEPALTCFSPAAQDCEYYMIIHGYKSNSEVDWVIKMRKALFSRNQNIAIFVVDWSAGADLSVFKYKDAADNLRYVYPYLNSIIKNLIDIEYLRPDRISNTLGLHCIGHSLGAHACGLLGKTLKNRQNLSLTRISGLDPAGPCFDSHKTENRLDKSDADFVDVIHTSRTFGIRESIGDVDFYPNHGTKQPDCWPWPLAKQDQKVSIYTTLWCNNKIEYETNETETSSPASQQAVVPSDLEQQRIASLCSHGRAIEYFIESVNSECKFVSHQCSSWENYKKNLCQECDTNNMGFPSQKMETSTHYYLDVNTDTPWCIASAKISPVSEAPVSFLQVVNRESSSTFDICIYSTAGRLTSKTLQQVLYLAVSFLLLKLFY